MVKTVMTTLYDGHQQRNIDPWMIEKLKRARGGVNSAKIAWFWFCHYRVAARAGATARAGEFSQKKFARRSRQPTTGKSSPSP
jgi:hypothetical protein